MSLIDIILEPISQIVKVPVDMLKYFSSFVLSIPLAYYCRLLPSNNESLKHKVYGAIGFLMSYIVFGSISFSLIFLAIPIYLFMDIYRTKKAATIIFIILIIHLAVIHLYKTLTTGVVYKLSFSTVHMIFVIKFSSFCYSVADGASSKPTPSPHRDAMKIKKYPTPLEYFGFLYFFPGIFSGPCLEYTHYMDFITLRQFKDIDAKDKDENHLPNINYYEFFYRLAAGMSFYMIVWAVSIFQPKEVGYYALHEPGQHGFLFLMMMVVYTSEIGRVKYVGTWYIADSMSIIGGFGYAGTNNGEQTWNRFTNINFLIFESSDSIRKSIILWNKYVQNWLNQYVYLNMVGTSLEPLKDIMTNLISAFWHGFHAGYYLSFGGLTLHTQTSKLIFKKLTPYVKEKSGNDKTIMMIYNTILVIYTFFIVNYNFCPFFVMDFWASWAMLKQTYFSIHLLTLVIFIWLKFFPPRIHSQRDK